MPTLPRLRPWPPSQEGPDSQMDIQRQKSSIFSWGPGEAAWHRSALSVRDHSSQPFCSPWIVFLSFVAEALAAVFPFQPSLAFGNLTLAQTECFKPLDSGPPLPPSLTTSLMLLPGSSTAVSWTWSAVFQGTQVLPEYWALYCTNNSDLITNVQSIRWKQMAHVAEK